MQKTPWRLASFLIISLWLLPQNVFAQGKQTSLLERAFRLQRRAIALDAHVDIPGPEYATPQCDPGKEDAPLQVTLPAMEKGGMDGMFLAVYMPQDLLKPEKYAESYQEAMAKFDAIHRLPKMYPERAEIAKTPSDIHRIKRAGKRAIIISSENLYPIGMDLGKIRQYYDRGARCMGLVHFGHNQICTSSSPRNELGDPDTVTTGLTEFGKKVVQELNRLGVIIDLSHASSHTFWDTIAITRAPIIYSHSLCQGVNQGKKSLDDDQLRAIAKNGGTVQIVPFPGSLKPKPTDPNASPELETVTDFVAHINHVANLVGVDHVGIGSDFDGGAGIDGFTNPSQLPVVILELMRNGYDDQEIQKILGGNLLRVMGAAQRLREATLPHPM